MGNFFSKQKALWDQGLRGRGSKNDKVWKMTRETYSTNGKPCSIGLVTYTATTKPESSVSKRKNIDNKGYEFTRMVVTTTVRGAKRTNKDNKGYEITRPAVTTAVRRNPNERKKKKGLEMLERL